MPHELADLVALERARGVECRQLSERVAATKSGLNPARLKMSYEPMEQATVVGAASLTRRRLSAASLVFSSLPYAARG